MGFSGFGWHTKDCGYVVEKNERRMSTLTVASVVTIMLKSGLIGFGLGCYFASRV